MGRKRKDQNAPAAATPKVTAAAEPQANLGRPTGSKNVTDTAVCVPGRCTECGNTESDVEGYLPDRVPADGVDPFGNPANVIKVTRVRCTNPKCRHLRKDLRYENVVFELK